MYNPDVCVVDSLRMLVARSTSPSISTLPLARSHLELVLPPLIQDKKKSLETSLFLPPFPPCPLKINILPLRIKIKAYNLSAIKGLFTGIRQKKKSGLCIYVFALRSSGHQKSGFLSMSLNESLTVSSFPPPHLLSHFLFFLFILAIIFWAKKLLKYAWEVGERKK